jgi:hypothetical protein
MMTRFFRYLALLPPLLLALIFGAQGILWLVNPLRAARYMGFAVPGGGLGLSTMIGAMAGWALTIAICLMLGLIRKERMWFYPPMLIFGVLALGRIVAGLAHGAPLLPERFVPELIIVGLLLLAARSVEAPRAA